MEEKKGKGPRPISDYEISMRGWVWECFHFLFSFGRPGKRAPWAALENNPAGEPGNGWGRWGLFGNFVVQEPVGILRPKQNEYEKRTGNLVDLGGRARNNCNYGGRP